MIKLQARIAAFAHLGQKIKVLTATEITELAIQAQSKNGWFTKENIDLALDGIIQLLDADRLIEWTNRYSFGPNVHKVGIVMAGNIPMVGFHDFLSVLISGQTAIIKLSSQDEVLPQTMATWLTEIEPEFASHFVFADKLSEIDAVIATGSDNSARYFNQYFKHLPNIIRKNRTSLAIINGEESDEEIYRLGQDIFSYFGLGCRNISKILIPSGYDMTRFLDGLNAYSEILQHHKYNNNYDYNKSIYLVNGEQHLDNGFLLLKPSTDLISPLAVLFYEEYKNLENLEGYINSISEKLQCVVSANAWFSNSFDFGKAQTPEVDDYADGVDTLKFLAKLSQKAN